MSRSGESVTRLDIRFPNEMYNQMQQIAINDGARTHHISQKVEVSPTVIKLVQLGLNALNGKLPDTSGGVSGNLSDNSPITISDNNSNISDISDISDKRIEAIVDRRLIELGLFPDCQADDNSTSGSVPDKVAIVSDTLPDKDVMISDRVASLPDSISDTKNIPSGDSSNSEHVVNDVQIIPTDAIKQVSGEISESYSFAKFHEWLELKQPDNRNTANGATAIEVARSQGKGEWVMSRQFKFTKQQTGDN
jgi:hypothetical protein